MKYFNEYSIGEYYPHNNISWEWSDIGWYDLLPCYGFTFDGTNMTYAGCNTQYADYVNNNYKYYKSGQGLKGDDYYKVFEIDDNTFLALIINYPASASEDRLNNPPFNSYNNINILSAWQIGVTYTWIVNGNQTGSTSAGLLVPVHYAGEGSTPSYTEGNFNFNFLTLAISTYGSGNKYSLKSIFQRDSSPTVFHGYVDINSFTQYTPLLNETSGATITIPIPNQFYIDFEDLGTTPSLYREQHI